MRTVETTVAPAFEFLLLLLIAIVKIDDDGGDEFTYTSSISGTKILA